MWTDVICPVEGVDDGNTVANAGILVATLSVPGDEVDSTSTAGCDSNVVGRFVAGTKEGSIVVGAPVVDVLVGLGVDRLVVGVSVGATAGVVEGRLVGVSVKLFVGDCVGRSLV